MRVPRMKTAVPDLPAQFVSRNRLLSALDAGADGVTLVCAPPGYGKTLLLADWTRRTAGDTTAWVSLDRDDNHPDVLCAAVVAALAGCAAVPADSSLHRMRVPHGEARPEFVGDLVDALEALPVPLRLVLDDLQEIVGKESLRIVQQLVRQMPAGVRLLVSSRLDPPLSLVRLRLEGRLAELRADDLRFTGQEMTELLALGGPVLTPAQIAVLHAGTDGWPAGVRLAATSLAVAADPRRFLVEFSGDERSVADYLVDEVLSSLPPDTRDLLRDVSVCDPIPAELAAELSGRPDAAQVLNALERDTGLVTRGPSRSEYRVHVLLRSYLRADLARQRSGLLPRLNATAAEWWAARHRRGEALAQAMQGVPPPVLRDLLRRFAVPLLLTGDHPTLRRALDAIGGDGAPDPVLVAADAAVRAAAERRESNGVPHSDPGRNPDRGDRIPDDALRPGPGWAVPGADELGALGAVAGALAQDGGPDLDDTATSKAALTALNALVGGARLLSQQGDVVSGLRSFDTALDLARSHGFDYLRLQCEVLAAAAAAGLHDYTTMTAAADRALSVATDHSWQHTVWSGVAHAVLAYGALLRAEPNDAYRLASQALRDGHGDEPVLVFGLRAVRGAAACDSGQQAAGLEEMQHARADLGDIHLAPVQAAATSILEYRAALSGGHPVAAHTVLNWLHRRVGQCGETQLMRAWSEMRAGRRAAARAALRPLLDGSTPALLPHTTVEGRLAEAQLDVAVGDRPGARRAVRQALADAGALGVLRPFVLGGSSVHEVLVHQIGSFGAAEPVAEAALAALRRTGDPSAARVLSPREVAVLSLLPTLLSLEEIADELEVSVNTVKSHTRAIYVKLGVSTRRGAVVAAHERGLLPVGPAGGWAVMPGSRPPSRA